VKTTKGRRALDADRTDCISGILWNVSLVAVLSAVQLDISVGAVLFCRQTPQAG